MGWLVHAKIVAITLASTYPFIALVRSLTELSDFRPCDDGCVFLRYVGSGGLPSSRVQHLAGAEASSGARWEFLPRFVFVRNGHPVVSASLWEAAGSFEAAFVAFAGPSLFPLSAVAALREGEEALCSPEWPPGAEHPVCSSPEMKGRIVNHLEEGVTQHLYVGSVLAWAILKIAHDSALTAGWSQFSTIRLGLVSWMAQSFACGFSFAWSLGIIEVFAVKYAVDDTCFACYYQLPTVATVLAMSTPLLLMHLVLTPIILLPPLICSISSVGGAENMHKLWSWNCGGAYILFALCDAHWLFCLRDSSRALRIKVLLNPTGWSSSDWQRLAAAQPSMQLGESAAVAREFDASGSELGDDFEGYLAARLRRRLGSSARGRRKNAWEALVGAEDSGSASGEESSSSS